MQNSGGGLKFVTAAGSYDIVTSQNKYTVGAVVIRADDVSPASIDGGTWTRIAEGRTIIGASTDYPLNSEGGSVTSVHQHEGGTLYAHVAPGENGVIMGIERSITQWNAELEFVAKRVSHSENVGFGAGIGGETSIATSSTLQPYIALSIWQKIAD